MNFECVSVNGFAGDRTPEAMLECHNFAVAFAKHFEFPYELVGDPSLAKNLPWHEAIFESKQTFKNIIDNLKRIFQGKRSPILITPRCASAIASLPVIIGEFPDTIVLYFDAHGDLNTPQTSDSSYLGGMPLTAVMGEWDSGYGAGLKSSNLVHIGGREFDSAEIEFIENKRLRTISRAKIESDLTHLRAIVKGKPVFIHLDTDVFDPKEVRAEYAVDDGLFSHHVRKIVDIVLEEARLIGIEITEFSPRNTSERNKSYAAIFDSFRGLRD